MHAQYRCKKETSILYLYFFFSLFVSILDCGVSTPLPTMLMTHEASHIAGRAVRTGQEAHTDVVSDVVVFASVAHSNGN